MFLLQQYSIFRKSFQKEIPSDKSEKFFSKKFVRVPKL
jgi:hypothetical protein